MPPSAIFNALAANTGLVKSLDLINATIPFGESRTVCGAKLFNKEGGRTCMTIANFQPVAITVSPTWFAATAYCNDYFDYGDDDRRLQCAKDLAKGQGFSVNPKGGRTPGRVEVEQTILLPGGTVPPGGLNPKFLINGGIPLVGHDGSSLIGLDGGSLVGHDGSSLIGQDGSSLIGQDGSSLIGQDGSSLRITAGSLIGQDGSSRPDDLAWDRQEYAVSTGNSSTKLPSPLAPGDLTTRTGGYVVATGSGGSQPTVTYSYDEVTDEAFATIKMTFDETSNPKVSNLGNIAFALNLNPPVVRLNSSTTTVDEGAGFAAVTFERIGDTSLPATLDYTTSGGTGTAVCSQSNTNAGERCDFAITLGTVRFEAGETVKEIRIPIIDDNYAEGNETLKLIIGNPVGAALRLPGSATITITDNDSATGTVNPLDGADARFFARQQYLDLLGREPSAAELAAGADSIVACGSDETCRRTKRIDLSQTVMLEGQKAAGFVFRLYRAAFGNTQPFPNPDTANAVESNKWPAYSALSRDRALIVDGPNFAQSQIDLANSFVLRPAFTRKYSPATITDGPAFVDAILATLNTNLGVDMTSQRTALINVYDLAGGTLAGRGAVLYRLAQSSTSNPVNNTPFVSAEDNRAFASNLYLGYLKRDGDVGALNSLLTQLQAGSDRRGFVDQFVNGTEYRLRFGAAASTGLISGRVVTPSGLALRNAVVSLIDAQGVRRTATTSSFGVYSLENVRSGETYIISVSSKRYRFAPRNVSVTGNLTNVDFFGLE